MKNIIYDAQTGETTIIEVPDIDMPAVPETPTIEKRVTLTQDAVDFVLMYY